MGITYTYFDVLTMVGKTMPKAAEDQFAATACNLATNLIWDQYDWRESLVELPPFYLLPNEQDHFLPPITLPTDFMGLREARMARYTEGAIAKIPMAVVANLELTHIKNIPHSIAYQASRACFRLFPRVPKNVGSPTWFVEGTYKKKPGTPITNATLDTLLPFDDKYIHVMVECVRWALMMLSGNQNAGQAQMNGPQMIYSGQLANAMSAIEMMATDQGVNDGDIRIAPSSALVPGALGTPYNFPSLFGVYG